MRVAPNPSNGRFVLKGSLNQNYEQLVLKIYDSLGRVIAESTVQTIGNTIEQEFDFSSVLTKGIYFAKLTNGKNTLDTFKVLVQ